MLNNTIYNKCKKRIAKKHDLGNTLVTGHREKFFIEAFVLYLRTVKLYKL